MRQLHDIGRALGFVASAATIVLSTAQSQGETPHGKGRRVCAGAYENAQELEHATKLRRAKETFLTCARSTCGVYLQRECTRAAARVETGIASVVLSPKDDEGLPLVDVQVTMDGELLTSRLDGRALPVDPGLHNFVFKTARGASQEQRIPVAQGERNHAISVALRAEPTLAPKLPSSPGAGLPRADAKVATETAPIEKAAPEKSVPAEKIATDAATTPSDKGGGSSVAPYIVGGLGVIGVAGYALLSSSARGANTDLQRCWPTCPQSSLDRVRQLYIAADVSLGAGIVAIGAATWLFASSGSANEKPAKQSSRYEVDVAPSRSGVFATVSGSF